MFCVERKRVEGGLAVGRRALKPRPLLSHSLLLRARLGVKVSPESRAKTRKAGSRYESMKGTKAYRYKRNANTS